MKRFPTQAVHAGAEPDASTGAIMTPIFQTSTYVQEAPGKHKGFDYSRSINPTRLALEKCLAQLEGGAGGLAFGSGMAAISTVVMSLNPGDRVVSGRDVYGGTYRTFTKVFARFGVKFEFVDSTDLKAVEAALKQPTTMVWLESPSNPMMQVSDIKKIAKLAKAKGAKTVVDNTFATPALQKPLDLGADIVVHSTTKYLGGHSDVVGGAVVCKDPADHEKIKFLQNAVGAVPGPMDSFLVLRGIKTLSVRMEAHCRNARKVAETLASHAGVKKVHYPGLKAHPGHKLAKEQMCDFGGMMSFELKGDSMERALRFLKRLEVFSLAESLGGVESLVGHPATMTHASIPREERLKAGLTDTLIRLSVGIEDAQDLCDDLSQAVSASE